MILVLLLRCCTYVREYRGGTQLSRSSRVMPSSASYRTSTEAKHNIGVRNTWYVVVMMVLLYQVEVIPRQFGVEAHSYCVCKTQLP